MVDPRVLGGRLGNQMFQLAYLYGQFKDGAIPDIYAQDFRLWEKHKDEIKQWFSQGIGIMPYVAIHLRVGKNPLVSSEPKYNENPFYYNLVETGYYIKALENFPDGKFIVFSDDVEFAKTYFEGDRFAFDDSQDDIEAFNKMASCDGHIIANSSFSWWAAFLSPNHGKVCYPSEWFSDKIKRVSFPEEWIEIKV